MTIELTITGDHATDVISEVALLAKALGVVDTVNPVEPVQTPQPATVEEEKPKKVKMTAQEQSKAVKEMIETGEKDDRFDSLTKGRKEKVEAALVVEESTDEPIETPVEEVLVEPVVKVSQDDIRDLMSKVAMKNGEYQQNSMMVKIHAEIKKLVPEGKDIKVSNIPDEKLGELKTALEAL